MKKIIIVLVVLFILSVIFIMSPIFRDIYWDQKMKNEFITTVTQQDSASLSFVSQDSFLEKTLFDCKVISVNSGDTIDLKNYRDKAIFLNYWFTSCAACIEEFPSIMQFYQDKKDKIFFFIITNEDPEVVQAFLKKRNFNLPFYYLENRTFPQATVAYPTSFFFINKKPILAHTGVGYFDEDEFYEFIEKKLNNP